MAHCIVRLWQWLDEAKQRTGNPPPTQLFAENKSVYAALWRGLQRREFTATDELQQTIDAHLQQILQQAGWLATARQAGRDAADEPLLVDALTNELALKRSMVISPAGLSNWRWILTLPMQLTSHWKRQAAPSIYHLYSVNGSEVSHLRK